MKEFHLYTKYREKHIHITVFSRDIRRPDLCYIRKYKGADHLRGNRAADRRFCFCFIDSVVATIS